jgi:short-subunit dehydrogenase
MAPHGKVAIITGASSGFGREAALLAAKRGYRVVAAARRVERLEELVREIMSQGGTAVAVPCDVTKSEDLQHVVDRALAEYGRIDVLVNNAGVPLSKGFIDASIDDLRRQWDTNTTSVLELTKRALPALAASKGVVINISSLASRASVPFWGVYFPTKVAMSSLSDALRRELMVLGVRVANVEPGPFNTEFGQRAGMAAPDQQLGLDPTLVATTILELMERPRRLVVVPGWMRPLGLVQGGLARGLPDVIDAVFWLLAKVKQRRGTLPPVRGGEK